MGRRVLVIERSPLARNIYFMILSKLDQIDLASEESSESMVKIGENAAKSNLVIMSQSTLGDRKGEFFGMAKNLSKKSKVPCVIFVNEGQISEWKDFAGLKNVEVIEKPFFPDDFLSAMKKVWGVK